MGPRAASVAFPTGMYDAGVVPMDETLEQPVDADIAGCGAHAALRGTLRYVNDGCWYCSPCWTWPELCWPGTERGGL